MKEIEGSLDRFQEAHFFLHGMELNYHFSEPFRWSLNAFLRALKEVPQLLQMELQNRPGFVSWYEPRRTELKADPLVQYLSAQRDVVVHIRMLRPHSTAMLGITEGRGIKVGLGRELDPMLDSDVEMKRFLNALQAVGDFLGLLEDDEESLPCIERSWRLPEFRDQDILDLAGTAWLRVGDPS